MSIGLIVFLLLRAVFVIADDTLFDKNYFITYGSDHIISEGNTKHLFMDIHSGAGFESKSSFGSGIFNMKIKLHRGYSAGIVTTFYLMSRTSIHDELDFEFLGQREGRPIELQTNVFVNGVGNREQTIHLWFDPAADFHDYTILWNQHQTVFLVDNIPIRVYKNKTNIGAAYPTQPMDIQATIWDGSAWATEGGRLKADYTKAPFNAYYQGFDIAGCAFLNGNIKDCYSPKYPWNTWWTLHPVQQAAYDNVKKKYMIYDYCVGRIPVPPECIHN